jgi:hypothetical protein
MAISLSNVTGVTGVSGSANPTWTVAADTPPAGVRGKQWTVTTLGGTQTGVEVNIVGNPFTITFESPSAPKGPPATSSSTGQPISVPRNTTRVLIRKGVEVVSGYRFPMEVDIAIRVPCGAEQQDAESVSAGINFAASALYQIVSGLRDTLISGSP